MISIPEQMKVQCPECKTIKTIDKTNSNIQVRCSKRAGGCGLKYYTLANIVDPDETIKTNKTEKVKGKTNKIDDVNYNIFVKDFKAKAIKKAKITEYILAINHGHKKYLEHGFETNHAFLAEIIKLIGEL